jgi:type II secretory pathway component PulJ
MLERRQQRAARAQAAAEARKAATAAHYARQKISPVLLEQYDRNRNGRLDPHEWERHRQDLNRLLAEPRQRPQPAPAAAAEPGK